MGEQPAVGVGGFQFKETCVNEFTFSGDQVKAVLIILEMRKI